jgi:uncharacterized membrane protein YcaP (DUF421 family)
MLREKRHTDTGHIVLGYLELSGELGVILANSEDSKAFIVGYRPFMMTAKPCYLIDKHLEIR